MRAPRFTLMIRDNPMFVLTDAGCTVTFLVRSLATLQNDEVMSKHIKAGKGFLVKGETLVKSDVENGWNKAGERGPINLLLFTVGTSTTHVPPGVGHRFTRDFLHLKWHRG